jgi:hypothetical protein
MPTPSDCPPEFPRPEKGIPGWWGLIALLIVALGLVLFAQWFRYSQLTPPLDFWGEETLILIQTATQVEIAQLTLVPPDTKPAADTEQITFQGNTYHLGPAKELIGAPGFTHVRRSLISAAGYDWNDASDCTPTWEYAVTFAEADRRATLLFALGDCPRAGRLGQEQIVSIRPLIPGLDVFCAEQFYPRTEPQTAAPTAE